MPDPDPLPKMPGAVTVPHDKRKPISKEPQFISEQAIPGDAWTQCFEAAKLMVLDPDGGVAGVTLDDKYDRIWITTGLPSHDGRTKSDPKSAAAAREYVDRMLDKGLRVLVGASWGSGVHSTATNHFLAVYGRGYDADGKVFYRFKDPGTTKTEYSDGKLYVDGATGKMFRLGEHPSWNQAPVSNYEVTEVRTYPQFPPKL